MGLNTNEVIPTRPKLGPPHCPFWGKWSDRLCARDRAQGPPVGSEDLRKREMVLSTGSACVEIWDL